MANIAIDDIGQLQTGCFGHAANANDSRPATGQIWPRGNTTQGK